jgi:O-antigen ligase
MTIDGGHDMSQSPGHQWIQRVKHLLTSTALVAGIVAIPFNPRYVFWALIFLAIAALFTLAVDRQWTRPGRLVFMLMLMYMVRVIWFFVGTADMKYRLKYLEGESSLMLIPVIFLLLDITPNIRRCAILAFISMAFATIAFSFARLYQSVSNATESTSEFFKHYFENAQFNSLLHMINWEFGHYSFLGMIIIYGLIVLYWLRPLSRIGWLLGVIVYSIGAVAFVIFTGSRVCLLLLLVMPFLFALLERGYLRNLKLTALLAVIGCAVLGWVFARYYQQFDIMRYDMLVIGWNRFIEAPIMGHGTGSLPELMHVELFEYNYTTTVNHPHNQYLGELMQFGIVGTIPLLLFIGFGITDGLVGGSKCDHATVAMVISMALFMLIETPVHSNKGLVPFVLLVCLLSEGKRLNLLGKQSEVSTRLA